jgi:hypothetical protein
MKKIIHFQTNPLSRTSLRTTLTHLTVLLVTALVCMSFNHVHELQDPPEFVTLNASTTVHLRLANDYTQNDLHVKTDVKFEAERDILVDDIAVIKTYASAYGTVIELHDVIAVNQQPVLLEFTLTITRTAREGSIFLKTGMTISPKVRNNTRIYLTARH